MLEVDIPGFGLVRLEYLVSDFTGTLSVDGKALPGVEENLNRIADLMEVHILTADTFGMVRAELSNVKCAINILSGSAHDEQKEAYIKTLVPLLFFAFTFAPIEIK